MRKLYTVLLLSLVLAACGSDNGTSSSVNPFAGTWNVVFGGSATGAGRMIIGSDGSFSVNVILIDMNGTTYSSTISGNVSNSGAMNARILEGGQQTGTVTGSFMGNAASGTYQTNYGTSGTWSATRQ